MYIEALIEEAIELFANDMPLPMDLQVLLLNAGVDINALEYGDNS